METLQTALSEAKKQLRLMGIESWALDAELIMGAACGLDRTQLITHGNLHLSNAIKNNFDIMVIRRLKFEPIQYILNKAEFMGMEFYVDENVLIPRPDTECVTEFAISYTNMTEAETVMDMCTGSGCIAVSIAKFCPHVTTILACDISPKALEIAGKNAEANHVAHKMAFVETDMFLNVPIQHKFDVIVSNPPYISEEEMIFLSTNVKNYEPHTALYGGKEGYDFYIALAEGGKHCLKGGGHIIVEIGAFQKVGVMDIFNAKGYTTQSHQKDLAGLDRAIAFKLVC